MVNVTHIITSVSAWWNPEMLDIRQFAVKRADLIVASYEHQELLSMYDRCKAKLAEVEVALAKAQKDLDETLNTGAVAILQKEIDDGKALVTTTRWRCRQYAGGIIEVSQAKPKLAKEVNDMQKRSKGQLMAEELDRVAKEAGRL